MIYGSACSGIAPRVLLSDAGGMATPTIFEWRFVRNRRGAPDALAPPLKAQSGGTGKGDGAPRSIMWTA